MLENEKAAEAAMKRQDKDNHFFETNKSDTQLSAPGLFAQERGQDCPPGVPHGQETVTGTTAGEEERENSTDKQAQPNGHVPPLDVFKQRRQADADISFTDDYAALISAELEKADKLKNEVSETDSRTKDSAFQAQAETKEEKAKKGTSPIVKVSDLKNTGQSQPSFAVDSCDINSLVVNLEEDVPEPVPLIRIGDIPLFTA
ncbi:hypothetical protein Barb7_00960 [Bacteroidales bacterium Barb7]|nr:hypothetical protein Barb7_00960 [Bacteroidales bacterium Barb7]